MLVSANTFFTELFWGITGHKLKMSCKMFFIFISASKSNITYGVVLVLQKIAGKINAALYYILHDRHAEKLFIYMLEVGGA